jgi:hypothetical protein
LTKIFRCAVVWVHGSDPGGRYGQQGDGGAAGGAARPRSQCGGGKLLQRTHDRLHARIHSGRAFKFFLNIRYPDEYSI